MDYSEYLFSDKTYTVKPNKYQGQMYSFFKWQWNLMRNDKKSIKF